MLSNGLTGGVLLEGWFSTSERQHTLENIIDSYEWECVVSLHGMTKEALMVHSRNNGNLRQIHTFFVVEKQGFSRVRGFEHAKNGNENIGKNPTSTDEESAKVVYHEMLYSFCAGGYRAGRVTVIVIVIVTILVLR